MGYEPTAGRKTAGRGEAQRWELPACPAFPPIWHRARFGQWDFRVRSDPKARRLPERRGRWQGWGDSAQLWVVALAGSASRTALTC